MPEIDVDSPKEAFHETNNITLLGERLSLELNKRNIVTIHDKSDIGSILMERELSFQHSYEVSREILTDILEYSNSITMAFDIHRDAAERKVTTYTINGIDHSRISFEISSSSHNFSENQEFAKQLHESIEEKYPGLSRGVRIIPNKNRDQESTYNQDLLAQNVMLNVGGAENTMEEGYRTVSILADVIQEIAEERN